MAYPSVRLGLCSAVKGARCGLGPAVQEKRAVPALVGIGVNLGRLIDDAAGGTGDETRRYVVDT